MFEKPISNDANKLLCLLYKGYLEKRKSGETKDKAKSFGGYLNIQQNFVPKWTPDDTDDTCRELDREGYIECRYYDGHVFSSALNDSAVVYMENRFKSGLSEVMDTISKFVP